MKNQLTIAKIVVELLNILYEEEIFAIRPNSDSDEAVIINQKYRYEGNDLDISFSKEGIFCTITGAMVDFADVPELIYCIDELFDREENINNN